MGELVVIVIVFIIAIIILRLFGAWMLRIDELIKEQKRTNEILSEGFYKFNQNINQDIHKVGGIGKKDTENKF